MRTEKRKMITALVLSVAFVGISGAASIKPVQAAQSKEEKVLLKKAQELAKKEEANLEPSYVLHDITGDKVPELLYERHYNRSELCIYRYDVSSGKAKLMKTTDGEKSIGGVTEVKKAADGKKLVVYLADSAYSGGIYTYKASGKKLKASVKYEYDFNANTFTKNGKEITEAAYEKYQKKVNKLERVEFTSVDQ